MIERPKDSLLGIMVRNSKDIGPADVDGYMEKMFRRQKREAQSHGTSYDKFASAADAVLSGESRGCYIWAGD